MRPRNDEPVALDAADESPTDEPLGSGWPDPPPSAAYHGLVGEIVRAIEPHSEADPVAMLAQLLVLVGAFIGRNRFAPIEGVKHFTNLYMLVVGETAAGRKGTAYNQVRAFMAEAFPEFMINNEKHGLTSGEGLIHAVRDAVDGDAGVTDKRLVAYEAEFAAVLRVLERDGNTLSARLRQGYDGATLQTLSRASPLVATNPHISIIGHITPDELRNRLRKVEITNGLLNRFIVACSRRSKRRPHGGNVPIEDIQRLGGELRMVLEAARRASYPVDRDDAANRLWESVYDELTEGYSGNLGYILGRATAHVVRLSIIYAVLDGALDVKSEHLEAALAFWRYAVDSARYLFGGSDPVSRCAERIVVALREVAPDALTRTQIRDLFGRHADPGDLEQALRSIEARGLGSREKRATGGRPVERWCAATKAQEAPKPDIPDVDQPSVAFVASVAPPPTGSVIGRDGYPANWDEVEP